MPGFTYPSVGTVGALAIALSLVLSPGGARPVRTPPPAAGGTAAVAALQAATGRGTAAAGGSAFQPGGPLVGGRVGGAPTFAPVSGGLASTNWAGYAALRTSSPFRYVEAAFFVPYVDCSATPNDFSAHWVGLDGEDTDTVEQAGVLATCEGTTAKYASWYEMFPRPPVYVNLPVRPGDSIVASVYYLHDTGRFVLRLVDTTTGRRFGTALGCPKGATCRRASAEIISEAPSSNGRLLPLTDFRALSFSGIRVTDQPGHRSGLRSRWWRYTSITMVRETDGAAVDQPTQLYTGEAFDNYWMRAS